MTQRPVNLDFRTLKFPPMAVASLLHRISGVVLFLGLPWVFYILHLSLKSHESFGYIENILNKPINTLLLWIWLSAVMYHVCAGIRHLLLDCELGTSLKAARQSAYAVIALSLLLSLWIGELLW